MPKIHWTQTPEGKARISAQSKAMHAKKRKAVKANPDIPYNKQRVGGKSKWPLSAQRTVAGRAEKEKKIERTQAEKGLHWTQTTEGKKRMSEAQLAANARRRNAGLPTPTGHRYKSAKKPFRHTSESRKKISDAMRRLHGVAIPGETMAPTTNGHGPEVGHLSIAGKKLTKESWRQLGLIGAQVYRQRLVDELQAIDMVLKQ